MSKIINLSIGSDHGGHGLKLEILDYLSKLDKNLYTINISDYGTKSNNDKAEYPDVAKLVCNDVLNNKSEKAILICGSGIGISIAANKVEGIRCALCHDHYTALMCRQHNDANVLALGGRVTGPEVAKDMVFTFLNTEFVGAHHVARVEKLKSEYLNKSQ